MSKTALITTAILFFKLISTASAFDSFEVKSFDVIVDTKAKAEKSYKAVLAAQAKGIQNSELLLQSKDEKEHSLVLKGKFTCFNKDESKASILQGSLEIKTKDKKVKFSFENIIFGYSFDAIKESSADDAKIEEAKKCVKPLVDDYLKEINKNDAW
jgi:hypothetical protein